MNIEISRLTRRELLKLHQYMSLKAIEIHHQRGSCESNNCNTCLYRELCGIVLGIQKQTEITLTRRPE